MERGDISTPIRDIGATSPDVSTARGDHGDRGGEFSKSLRVIGKHSGEFGARIGDLG
jgi:hypothetical protein